jgi:hypothetical protein
VLMPEVFVSHAAADGALVDPFVDTVLKLGCGLDEAKIFYSSGEDTGLPSGFDLLHHVREEAAEAGLVVAIISPMFETRPVCVAELGAAWSRTGNLFPLAVPGMARTDMEGVLAVNDRSLHRRRGRSGRVARARPRRRRHVRETTYSCTLSWCIGFRYGRLVGRSMLPLCKDAHTSGFGPSPRQS